MAIRCKDVIQLPALKKMKVVAGGEGLDRIIRWVHVGEVPNVAHWLHGGELLFITGVWIKNNTNALLNLVRETEAKKLAGIVINLGPYIKEIPQAVIDLANFLNFPIFELPWNVKVVDVTHIICSAIIMEQIEEKSKENLLEDILFGDYKSLDNILNRATFHGLDLTLPLQVMIVDIDNFTNYIREKGIKDEVRLHELKNNFKHVALRVIGSYSKKVLSMLKSDSVVVVMQVDSGKEKQRLKSIAKEIQDAVPRHMPGLTVSVGIGNSYNTIEEIKKSYNEAELSLKVTKLSGNGSSVSCYSELGVYKLLFKTSDNRELEAFHNEILGKLIENDRLYGSKLIETLEIFLEENGNVVKAAEYMKLHRNTLKYRLKRIEEITKSNLHNSYDRLNFSMALAIKKFLGLSY